MTDDRDIHTVALTDETIEITYADRKEITPQGAQFRTVLFPRTAVDKEYDEVMEALYDCLDRGLLGMRNPPKLLPIPEADVDEDD